MESVRHAHGHFLNSERLETFKGSISKNKNKKSYQTKSKSQEYKKKKTTREILRLEQGDKGGINQNEGAEAWRPIKGFRMTQVNQATFDHIQMWRGSQVIRIEMSKSNLRK